MSSTEKYPKEVEKILAKYPPEHKRSAVMPLLYLAHREDGYLTKAAMQDVARIVDISETDNAYLIKGEIPGVKKEDVKVTIQEGMLTIQGERKQEKEEKGKKFHRVECCYGHFMRSFRVPDDADESAVKAEFKDGMLNGTLPKSAKAKAKSINVSVT